MVCIGDVSERIYRSAFVVAVSILRFLVLIYLTFVFVSE